MSRPAAWSVTVPSAIAQAFGFTHWNAEASKKLSGRPSIAASCGGAARAIFSASQRR